MRTKQTKKGRRAGREIKEIEMERAKCEHQSERLRETGMKERDKDRMRERETGRERQTAKQADRETGRQRETQSCQNTLQIKGGNAFDLLLKALDVQICL